MVNKKRIVLITACNLFPNDGGDKITTWGLLNKLNELSDVYLLNVIDERKYTKEEEKKVKNLCKSLFVYEEKFFPTALSFFLSYLYCDAYMVVRRSRKNQIKKQIAQQIEDIKPDNIIWDHVRTTSYFTANKCYNILFEHNYEAGIYAEKIRLYPKIIRAILKKQVDFTDSFNRKIDETMQKLVYVSASDAAHYNFPHATIWQYKNIIFPHKINQIKEKSTINLLFVGSLEWYPNVEGISWFVEAVFPLLSEKYTLTVIGKNPSEKLKSKLAGSKRIQSFFNVPSVEQYYLDADIFIAPIFLGLGVNVKITEAASYNIPMVVTSHSLKGYDSVEFLPVADEPNDFAKEIINLSDTALRTKQSELIKNWHGNYLEKADKLFAELYNLV